MLSASAIVKLHNQLVESWHTKPESLDDAPPSDWLTLISRQHRANFDLWHIEDEARSPGVTDAELAAVKHRIDRTNQQRNDLAEELDRVLLLWLEAQGLPNQNAPLNSESPGLIIDRLSILALKLYHTREEAGCLDALWRETLAGTRRFKLYRQLKMYNDPALNPAIYRNLPSHLPH